jgi:hypothetical protein
MGQANRLPFPIAPDRGRGTSGHQIAAGAPAGTSGHQRAPDRGRGTSGHQIAAGAPAGTRSRQGHQRAPDRGRDAESLFMLQAHFVLAESQSPVYTWNHGTRRKTPGPGERCHEAGRLREGSGLRAGVTARVRVRADPTENPKTLVKKWTPVETARVKTESRQNKNERPSIRKCAGVILKMSVHDEGNASTKCGCACAYI